MTSIFDDPSAFADEALDCFVAANRQPFLGAFLMFGTRRLKNKADDLLD